MAQNIDIRTTRRTLGLIGAAACLVAVGMISVSGQAFAGAGGGGGHAGGGHAGGGGPMGGGHMAAGHGGFGHGGYGHGGYAHGGYGRGGFYRNGRHYYYGADGVVVEDCCYAPPIYVAPPLPVVVAPFGIFVR